MTKNIEIEASSERQLVRSVHRNARCRPAKNGRGFFVSYMDKNETIWTIGFDFTSRAGAWRDAARIIGQKMIDKLES